MVAALVTVGTVIYQRVAARSRAVSVHVLSSRPDAVTGGDARVRVTVPRGASPDRLTVRLNGQDVTDAFTGRGDGVEGVVHGLAAGPNTLQASVPGAGATAVTLSNHPSTGPLLAGPQEKPFVCQTEEFTLVTGQTLGEPLDENCSIAPRVDYVYRSTTKGAFVGLSEEARRQPDQRPEDLDTVRMPDGSDAPYIVRVETRTIDRGIAQVAMLDDPADPGRDLWNHKLVYTFGGGCDKGWYVQGTATGGVMSPRLLSQGYAVASNSLNVFGHNCNDLLAAEAFAMTREQFIEDHGLPTYTMGVGCSGGSYQAHQIADNYPGLLNGILVGCSFADVGFDTGQKLFDARLLSSYYRHFPGRLTAEQQRAISGFGSLAAVAAMSNAAGRLKPDGAFDPAVPVGDRYNATSNPRGARSTIWDHTINVYGAYARTGFARRPMDNVGVQYGLKAFEDGLITADQFVDLNQKIGGLDLDLRGTSTRTAGDRKAVAAAYATGRVLNGGGGLSSIPIIDFRSYTEGPTSTDLHMRYHTFVTEARLVVANGDADNRVLLTVDGKQGFDLERGQLATAFDALDRWILEVQRTGRSGHRTVVQSKPADLVDACWSPSGEKIVEKQTYDAPGRCNELYPSFSAPRLVAGEPLASNVLVCTLKAIDPASYPRPLTSVQLDRMRSVFPDGVCDWDQPGQGQQRPSRPWIFVR